MNPKELYELMNANPVFYLATLDEGSPRVRGMLLFKADESGIVFHSGTMKDLYSQFKKCPSAELCFFDPKRGIQVRVSGALEIVDDQQLKNEIYNHPSRQFLKVWKESGVLNDVHNKLVVFRLKKGMVTTWTMDTNFEPKKYIAL